MSVPSGVLSEKMSQRWVLSETSCQELLSLEVDMVVLSKELTRLEDMCIRIGNSLHELRVSVSEQDFNNSGVS